MIMGKLAVLDGCAGRARHRRSGLLVAACLRCRQRRAGRALPSCRRSSSRSARWSIFRALKLWLLAERDRSASRTSEAAAPFLQWLGTALRVRRARLTYGSLLMIVLAALIWYVLQPHGVRAAMSTPSATTRTPRGSPASDINRALVIGVYAIAGLICALAGWVADRAHRRDQRRSSGGRRQPRLASPPW